MAVYFNDKAKKEKEAYDNDLSQGIDYYYKDHEKASRDYQRNRSIGFGLAVFGGIGVALSIIF